MAKTDIYSARKRSEIMRRVRGKDTAPELLVRRILRSLRVRFRGHVAGLPGRPDIAVPGMRKILLINGCFWHQHPGCSRAKLPQTRRGWWKRKLTRNSERDKKQIQALRRLGWSVRVIWECQTRDSIKLAGSLRAFLKE